MNVLLNSQQLLNYEQTTPELALAAIQASVARYQQGIERVIKHQADLPTWDDLVLAVDELDADLQGAFYAFLPMADRDQQWQDVMGQAFGEVEACFTDKFKNLELYTLYKRLTDSAIGQNLDTQKKATLTLILKEYHRGGVLLSSEVRVQVQALEAQLQALIGQFQYNFTDSVSSLSVHVEDKGRLTGLPDYLVTQLEDNAKAASLAGWLITCDLANFTTVLKYAEDRSLREDIYRAYLTRGASDPKTDNGAVIQKIAEARSDRARLLGFDSHMAFSLASKSIGTVADLQTFLGGLEQRIKPVIEASNSRLHSLAAEQGIDQIMPWDVEYLHEVGRGGERALTESQMQEYFPLETVVAALIDLARHLFGVQLKKIDDPKAWHPSVSAFEVIQDHASLGYLYLDALLHEYKQPDTVQTLAYRHRRTDAEGRYHGAVVAMISDVRMGTDGVPPLLDHLALRKLFHEFGHALHSLLVRTSNHVLSDIRRLGNDGVEAAGKLFECWVWDADYLASISAHHQSGQRLEVAALRSLLVQLRADHSRACARTLSLSLLDFDLHLTPRDGRSLDDRVRDANNRAGRWPLAGFEKPLHGFDYLVAGYDAGFYAYLWADAHAWDLFTRFESAGLLDAAAGRSLLETFFEPAASRPFAQSHEAFLGRPLDNSRFLKHNGLL